MAADTTYLWLAARARNALRRRGLLAISAGAAFLAALLGLILIPRQATRVAQTIAAGIGSRVDTSGVASALRDARLRVAHEDSALRSARRVNAAAAVAATAVAPQAPVDTLSPALVAERDSIMSELSALSAAMERANESPLPPAFRALGETPALRNEAHVRVWLDSLDQVDKLRAPFGALGAGDPIYVSLTARVNELGRSIRDAASDKRAELRARLAPLAPPPPRVAAVHVSMSHVDTVPILASFTAAMQEAAQEARELDSLRAINVHADTTAERARELANVGAPPGAMLAAALVIALAIGFGITLAGELRHPRVAHVREGEAVSGVRVLAVVEPSTAVKRARRRADVEAPPLIDVSSESYRSVYLHLAATDATVPVVTIAGDIPAVVATVAANVAATAAYEARSTLLVDADPASSAVAAVVRMPTEPGLAGVLHGGSTLSDAIAAATIGRDRPLDVLTSGRGRTATASPDAVRVVREGLTRLERRYDFIVIAATSSYVAHASDTIIPAPDVVLCAMIGVTRLADLRAMVKNLRAIGRIVHGVVLWNDEAPRVSPSRGASATES